MTDLVSTEPHAKAPSAALPPKHQSRVNTGGSEENRTFEPARQYVDEFFRRVFEQKNQIARNKDVALKNFEMYTSEKYNADDNLGLTLLVIAIEAIPEAGPILKTLKFFMSGGALAIRIKKAKKDDSEDDDETDGAKKLYDIGKEGYEAIKAHKELAEQREVLLEPVRNLNDLQDKSDQEEEQREVLEDHARAELNGHRYDPPDVDLETQVEKQLGPIPEGKGLADAMQKVRDEFELELYRDHYKGAWLSGDEIGGIPPRVVEHILKIGKLRGKFSTARELAAVWTLPVPALVPVPTPPPGP